MRSSNYLKLKNTKIGIAAKLSVVIVIALFGLQCSYFQSQKDRTYRLTNKTFEADKTLTFNEKDIEVYGLTMFDTDGKPDQLWQITPEGDDYYRIRNRSLADDRSFEVADGVNDNRIKMNVSAVDDGQLWEIIPVGQDYYRLSNKWLGPGKSLMTKKDEYYTLSLDAPAGTDTFLWKKIPVGNDYFRLVSKAHGDQVTLFPFGDGILGMEPAKDNTYNYQHWKAVPAGGDYFKFINGLDVYDKKDRSIDFLANAKNKFDIKMNATGNADTQRWKMEPAGGDYFRLVNANGKALQSKFTSEFNLIMADSDDKNPDQLWKILRKK